MSSMSYPLCIFIVILEALTGYVLGHGMMLDPPGRASRWRFNSSAPANYNDMEMFCGGIVNTWQVHGGKCGICGDNYSLRTPRPHEIGGEFGEGHIVASYKSGTNIPISVKIVANHRGHFVFDICSLDLGLETENCFDRLKISNGDAVYDLKSDENKMYNLQIYLPPNLQCKHCVLRWHYKAGNMWGQCENGSYALGCGPQEVYRSCADIRVIRN